MRQLTFPKVMDCVHISPNGMQEQVRYGQYEAIQIVKENGWPVNRGGILTPPRYLVKEVTKVDGTRVVFLEPFMLIHEKEYGDGSGRVAERSY